ncbi:MAG: tripeptidyl-peptidase Serine peptidase family [Nocardioides sp.]|nr:tripeptidyl-peptidase Serine peptidase family [Nocardioides sp.]
MKPTVLRWVVILMVVALVVGGGGLTLLVALGSGSSDGKASQPQPVTTVSTTPSPGATEPPRADLAAFYSQQLDWTACRDQFECATLTVPIDYKDPGAGSIGLALLKVPAAKPAERLGSLVVNPGGPGAPGTDYAASAATVFGQPLLDHFDIVGFDPRGTGASDPIDCISDSQLDAFLAADPAPDTPEEANGLVTSLAGFYRGCVENSDALIGHVTTVEAARDMDVLRAALGESTLTYFGASYGTKLGATYADLFPDKAGRLVLDGAVDVALSSREMSLGQAAGFERALRAYVQDCVDQTGGCFLGDTVEAGLTRVTQFLDAVDAQPLPTSDGRELEIGNAFYGIVLPLYSRDYWFILSQALTQAFAGDGSTLMKLSDLYAARGPNGYENNSSEAIYAINCLDDPYAITPAEVPAQIPAFKKVSPTFGEVFAWGLVGCEGIQVRATEKDPVITAAGAPPIVVVGTTRDPATPYEWAVALADELKSGVLVSRDGDGHTGYNAGNACVDSAVESYLVDGTVPKDGLKC